MRPIFSGRKKKKGKKLWELANPAKEILNLLKQGKESLGVLQRAFLRTGGKNSVTTRRILGDGRKFSHREAGGKRTAEFKEEKKKKT